ncbi:MAG: amino acid permease [Proteobacteria bacterium]|nr:amino acid permease [Pseudomonadota bacterium]
MSAKQLGLFTLCGLVVANMIGAGVFTTSGFSIGELGSPRLVLLAWLIGGAIALTGAISYGYLVRLNPQSGGEYFFLSRNLHPLAGFIAGWVSLLAGFTGAIAYSAMTLETYLLGSMRATAIPENFIASSVIVVAMLVHSIRMGYGTVTQNLAVVIKLCLLAGFILYAIFALPFEDWQGIGDSTPAAAQVTIFSFALSLMWISFSYSGFNAAIYIAGEVPDAKSIVPRAMLIGTALTALIYVLLNGIFVLIPPLEAIAFREDVAAITAAFIGGDSVELLVRGIIVLALFTSVSAMIMIGPRVYAKMADDGLMPKFLKFEGEVPRASIVMQSILALVVVWISTLRELLSYLGFMLGLSTAATVISLFVVVRQNPQWKSELPWFPWPPLVYVFFTLLITVLAAFNEPKQMLAALVTVLSGVVLFLLISRRTN